MNRERALAMIESIIKTRLEMHAVDLDTRAKEAVGNSVQELRGLVNEIFDDFDDRASTER